MIGKALVAFIDILGYKSLIQKHNNNLDVVKSIEEVIKKSTIDLIQGFKDLPYNNEAYRKHCNDILDLITVRVISDTILFTLQLLEVNSSPPHFTKEEAIKNTIFIYFRSIIHSCHFFIGKTGYIFRGGVSIGNHYESELDTSKSLFIFSEAYLKAVELEKSAIYPRIIIDEILWNYLNKISFLETDNCFIKDKDDKICLDIYHTFQNDENTKKILKDIKSGLELNINENRGSKKVLKKLKYFADFHNKKVSKNMLDFEHLKIDQNIWDQTLTGCCSNPFSLCLKRFFKSIT